MKFSDISKLKVGDRLKVRDSDIIVEVQEIDINDPERPLAVKSSEDFGIGINPIKFGLATISMYEDNIGWLYTSVLDLMIDGDIHAELLKRLLGNQRLVTLEDLERVKPCMPTYVVNEIKEIKMYNY